MSPDPLIRVELGVQVAYPRARGKLAEVLKTIQRAGGDLRAHFAHPLGNHCTSFFLCERPAEAALALEREGFDVETQTLVSVRLPNRPRTLRHLVETLEAEGIEMACTYATAAADDVLIVFRTDQDARTQDILQSYVLGPRGLGFPAPSPQPHLHPKSGSS